MLPASIPTLAASATICRLGRHSGFFHNLSELTNHFTSTDRTEGLIDGSVDAFAYKPDRPVAVQKVRATGMHAVKIADPVVRAAATGAGAVIHRNIDGKAIHSALNPALDEAFEDGSWGFRPVRNSWGMLAAVTETMESENRWVIASDDVRDVFEHVGIDDVLLAHRDLLENSLTGHFHEEDREQLLQLVETILRGPNANREIGIDQGNPYPTS